MCCLPALQHTPLNAPGIYIRTLIPDGPAASDGRLRIGDRILAVNGTSLIGADYQRYDPQRSAGSLAAGSRSAPAADRTTLKDSFKIPPLCLC